MLSEEVLKLTRTSECFALMMADPKIQWKLPRPGALTGHVLRHACTTVETILQIHGPAVFKVGYTSDPTNRFRNHRYGYEHDVYQKWEQLLVIYCSHECVGPAFLEATLILKYKGYSSAFRLVECLLVL